MELQWWQSTLMSLGVLFVLEKVIDLALAVRRWRRERKSGQKP